MIKVLLTIVFLFSSVVLAVAETTYKASANNKLEVMEIVTTMKEFTRDELTKEKTYLELQVTQLQARCAGAVADLDAKVRVLAAHIAESVTRGTIEREPKFGPEPREFEPEPEVSESSGSPF